MRTKILITSMMLFWAVAVWGQVYKALYNVKIKEKSDLKLVRSQTVKDCSFKVDNNETVKYTKTYKNSSDENSTITYTINGEKKDSIKADKIVTDIINIFDGKANICVDEKDKSKIHINYWLNGKYTVKKGVEVKTIDRKLKCDNKYSETSSAITALTDDRKYYLWKCDSSEISKNPDYYKHSNKVIEVYKKDRKIDYYLINKYDKDADYIVQLDNRQLISFKETGFEFGPITIPIKIRPGFTKNNISIEQEFTGDLNLGAFGGYKIGRYRARYVRGEGFTQLPTSLSCTVGGFLSFSSTSLDKTNTTAGDKPITNDSKKSIGIVSMGIGVMYSFYNFQVGFFGGLDLGVGSNAKNWNYNKKPWMGFGFAYNLSNFWKK